MPGLRIATTPRAATAVATGVVLIAAVCAGALVAQAPPTNARTVVFDGSLLITGDGRAAIEGSTFIVQNGMFTGVGRHGELTPPRGADRVDLSGKTVMPALVDVHTHLGYRTDATFRAENFTRDIVLDQLNRLASYGVAAVGSAGTDRGDVTLRLRDEPGQGFQGAQLRTAWRGLAPPDAGPNPPMRDAPFGVSSEADGRQRVRELAAQKVDFVKIWVDDRSGTVPKLSPTVYRAIIDEAHRQTLRVFAHIATLEDAKGLLRSGIDGFLHPMRDREVDDELLQLLRERPGVFFTATLLGPHRTGAREELSRMERNVAALSKSGVRIALGTDVGGSTAGGEFGWAEHLELEYMVAAGLTPDQAIVAATRTAAGVLRLDQLGAIAAGKSADFLVLDANPLDAITNTRRIARVYLRGDAVRPAR